MVIANFKNDSHPIVYGASQWNYGEVLRIQGLNLPKAVEIHFSLEKLQDRRYHESAQRKME